MNMNTTAATAAHPTLAQRTEPLAPALSDRHLLAARIVAYFQTNCHDEATAYGHNATDSSIIDLAVRETAEHFGIAPAKIRAITTQFAEMDVVV